MNIRKTTVFSLLMALLGIGCTTSSGFDPIEVDLSARKTPGPVATATPAPMATGSPRAPTPAATPAEPRPSAAPASPIATTPAPTVRPPTKVDAISPVTPESLVRSRIDGYNRRDIERLMRVYSEDARIYDPPDHLRDSGQARIRQAYLRRFAAAPDLRLAAEDFGSQGAYVVSREIESTAAGLGSAILVISEIRDQRIVREWILR
ncbi:MAG: nuclear transport factor 2 family protein [Acidobacteriota bacterium]